MSQTNFVINLDFAVPTDRLFAAIAGADGPLAWWTVTCEVNEAIGGQSRFDFPGNGFFNVMKNLKREPSRLFEWECVAQRHHERTGINDLQVGLGLVPQRKPACLSGAGQGTALAGAGCGVNYCDVTKGCMVNQR